MKNTRVLAILLAVILALSTFIGVSLTASAEEACRGYRCGDCYSYYGEECPHEWNDGRCSSCFGCYKAYF
jgi:hypothetical protein